MGRGVQRIAQSAAVGIGECGQQSGVEIIGAVRALSLSVANLARISAGGIVGVRSGLVAQGIRGLVDLSTVIPCHARGHSAASVEPSAHGSEISAWPSWGVEIRCYVGGLEAACVVCVRGLRQLYAARTKRGRG